MIVYVTGKQIITNQIIAERSQYDHVPSIGWQYRSQGPNNNYQYMFATWNGIIDTSFPPNPQGGTIEMTYWYVAIGGNGPVPEQADVTALLLGGEGDNGAFDATANPIDSVNGAVWSGGTSVSTTNGSVDIVSKTTLQSQKFSCWMILWGNGQAQDEHYSVEKKAYCIAMAVYAAAKPIKPLGPIEDVKRRIIDKRYLYADFLDENLGKFLDEVSRYAATSPDRLSKLLEDVEGISPKIVKDMLLDVKVACSRLDAIQTILNVLSKKQK